MMGEIVIDSDVVDHASYLHAPLHIVELAKRLDTLRSRDANMPRRSQGRKCIHAIVLTHQLPCNAPLALMVEYHIKTAI